MDKEDVAYMQWNIIQLWRRSKFRQILCDLTYMWNFLKNTHREAESRSVIAKAEVGCGGKWVKVNF